MPVEFYKYEGAGNDFVMIDNREGGFNPETELVKNICDRHFGVGADGLILLEKDSSLYFSMRYFNADGKEGSMCGNGGRCVVWFANNLGYDQSTFHFRAIDGIHQAEILDKKGSQSIVKLKMNDVLNLTKSGDYLLVDTGSPHILIPVKNLDEMDVYASGRKIRFSPEFQDEGINVNFMDRTGQQIKLRTYERGVENETLACGTGSVASAIAAMFTDAGLKSPVHISARGGELKVYVERTNQGFSNIWLEGPARMVFKGIISYDR